MYLDLNKNAECFFGGFKNFTKNEFHVTRVAREDVLILMLGGTLYFTENGVETELSKGEYYLQKSGLLQSALRPSDTARYIYFHFRGEWCENGIYGLPTKGRFDIEKIYRIAAKLCEDMEGRKVPYVRVASQFYSILWLLLEDNRRIDDGILLAEKIHSFISENYTKKLEVTDIATKFSYSLDYIIRVFKRAYGQTPHGFIVSCRTEYAKLLLSTTNKTVGEVSEACGYSDFTAFYRAFKSAAGVSPKGWRSSGK